MSEWKEYKLGEIGKVITGKTPPTKDQTNYGGRIPFVCIPDLGHDKRVINTIKTLTDKGKRSVKNLVLPKDSVMVSCIATVGKVGITSTESVTNQQINSIIPNEDLVISDYLFYWFLNEGDSIGKYGGGGSVFNIISKSKFEQIPIYIPPLPTQTAIAEILSSLDDKIELNNAINKNLEDLAQALFKRWFVDFEFPNEEGLPYQSSGGEMEESELGMIPEGWMVGKLGDFISFTKGKKPKSTTTIKEIGYLPQILIETFDTGKSVFASPEKMVIANESEIIMVMDGASSGRMEVGFSGIIGSTLAKINSKGICNSFIFYFLKLKEDDIKMNTTGAAIPHADKSLIIDYDISLPSKELLNQFDRINSEIWSLISIYKAEKNKLKFLRDMLLPKLISGELEVFEQSKKNDHAEI